MNERIKQLADQALKEFMDKHEYATVIVPDSLSQKFAELIVKECGDFTDPVTRNLMMKHFGVIE
jgi:ABC-type Zn uptake system ZnuABC Zn-binding protein ZnuA